MGLSHALFSKQISRQRLFERQQRQMLGNMRGKLTLILRARSWVDSKDDHFTVGLTAKKLYFI